MICYQLTFSWSDSKFTSKLQLYKDEEDDGDVPLEIGISVLLPLTLFALRNEPRDLDSRGRFPFIVNNASGFRVGFPFLAEFGIPIILRWL